MKKITLSLPRWLSREARIGQTIPNLGDRMEFVIGLSRRNVDENTGGPFGAAVFEIKTGKLIAAGVNRVVKCNCSLAHAEAMALMFAQKELGTFDLGAKGLPQIELVTSAQPCIQCFGNVWWAGIRRLVIGARGSDVEDLTGFDEGPLPPNWHRYLSERRNLPKVKVVRDFHRQAALKPLALYAQKGGKIYNAGSGVV